MLAAPKPLSMLTTETPDAQLFSMPSSAAIPPKLGAVANRGWNGDHRDGHESRHDAGQRASMPATTMMTRALAAVTFACRSRCRPATPTSHRRSTALPINSAGAGGFFRQPAGQRCRRHDEQRAVPGSDVLLPKRDEACGFEIGRTFGTTA